MSALSTEERHMRLGIVLAPLPKDQTKNIEAAPAASLPSALDWRNNNGNYVTGVRNQGACGSCWDFASTAGLESYTLIANKTPNYDLDLSEQVVLSCSGDGNCEMGGQLVTDFFVTTGVPLESCYPYTGADGNCTSACTNWLNNTYKIPNYTWIANGAQPTADVLKNALYRYGPTVVTMSVYDDFFSYVSGIYSHVWGNLEGAHAILLVGYDDANDCFIVKNSWGDGWGEQGFFRIAYSEVSDVVYFGGEALTYGNPMPTLNTLISPAGGGSVTANPQGPYHTGDQVQLTATPSSCYDFLNWSGDTAGISNPVTITMDSDKAITANFSIKRYYLTTGVNNPSGGAVTGGGSYDCGTSVQVTATPNPGYYFTGWSGDATGSANPINISMSADKNITANFKPKRYLIISSSTGGSVSVNPDNTSSYYTDGAIVTLTAAPNSGYIFLGWGGDASGTNNPLAVRMDSNKNITVNFGRQGLFLGDTQNGLSVTLSATLYFNGSPVPGKNIKFYEKSGAGNVAFKGTAKTNASGMAINTFTSKKGSNTAYANFNSTGGIPAMQSGNVSYLIDKVTLASPDSGSVITTPTPMLSWQAFSGADSYHVQVAKSRKFSAASLVLNTDTGETSISAPALLPGKAYYWRVLADIPDGKSMYSDIWKVAYRANTALKLELVGLIDSIVSVKATLTNADSGAPVSGKKIIFYENANGGLFASKGTAATAGLKSANPGAAIKSWKTSVGSHTAYVAYKGDGACSAVTTNPADVIYTRVK